ncbi:MAG: hypothetical protein ACI9R3_001790 [Verrucomicrobiales bacterium]|jgi:hypothetical protein
MKIAYKQLVSRAMPLLGVAALSSIIGCAEAQQNPTKKSAGQSSAVTATDVNAIRKWSVKIARKAWRITGKLQAPANISAIASSDGKNFIIGSDDLKFAQFGTIDRTARVLEVKGDVELLGKKEDDEVDIEGIAAAPGERQYFITGSHSLTKKGNMNKERRSIFRINVSASGEPQKDKDRASLRDVIQQDPSLRPYWEKAQQQGGINIEGLAWKGASLFAGLRSPNLANHALVIEVNAGSLFRKGRTRHQLHRVPLGNGLGIREIAPILEGFLIVAGNAGDEPTREFPVARDYQKNRGYELFFWNPESGAAVKLLRLPRLPGRPEALLVLEDSKTKSEFLLIFDGVIGGGPLQFTLTK